MIEIRIFNAKLQYRQRDFQQDASMAFCGVTDFGEWVDVPEVWEATLTRDYRLVKCFDSADMPAQCERVILDLLNGQDCVNHWVNNDGDPDEADTALYNWFLEKGAVHGEQVIIAHGRWTTGL